MELRKKKKKNGPAGAPSWMVTYSDMVTLLLTFFVLMLSMAEMDKIKFEQAVGSLRGAFGITDSELNRDPKSEFILPRFGTIPYEMMKKVYEQVDLTLKRFELDKQIDLVKDRGAIVLRVTEKILFDSGESKLKNGAEPVLRKVASLVSPWPFDVRIEGHTDDAPYSKFDQTNWDLSAQRAISVLKFFAQNELLSLDRLSAMGYADQRPLVPNDSEENRALNRRVEFVLEFGKDFKDSLPYLIDSTDQLPF